MVGSPENEVFRLLASRHNGVNAVSGSTIAAGRCFELCEALLTNGDTHVGQAGTLRAFE